MLLADLNDYVNDFLSGHQAPRMARHAIRAIRVALNQISAAHEWPELFHVINIATAATYETGTISSSDGKTITLTGGTWPTWAAGGLLIQNSKRALVQYRDSSTSVVCYDNYNYGASIAAGTAYKLHEVSFVLPEDTRGVYTLLGPDRLPVYDILWQDWLYNIVTSQATGIPYQMAIGQHPTADRAAVWFWPPPTQDKTIELAVLQRIREPKVDYRTGTVSITAATDVVNLSGTGAAFPSQVRRGTKLRFGTATTLPDELSDEVTVKTRNSSTQVTLDATYATGATAVKYIISDPIEVDEDVYGDLVWRAVEWKLCMLVPQLRRQREETYGWYLKALDNARELANVRMAQHYRRWGYTGSRPLRYWPQGVSNPGGTYTP